MNQCFQQKNYSLMLGFFNFNYLKTKIHNMQNKFLFSKNKTSFFFRSPKLQYFCFSVMLLESPTRRSSTFFYTLFAPLLTLRGWFSCKRQATYHFVSSSSKLWIRSLLTLYMPRSGSRCHACGESWTRHRAGVGHYPCLQ